MVVVAAEALTVHRIADRYLDGKIVAAFGPSPALERANSSVGSRHKAGAPAFADWPEKASTTGGQRPILHRMVSGPLGLVAHNTCSGTAGEDWR